MRTIYCAGTPVYDWLCYAPLSVEVGRELSNEQIQGLFLELRAYDTCMYQRIKLIDIVFLFVFVPVIFRCCL